MLTAQQNNKNLSEAIINHLIINKIQKNRNKNSIKHHAQNKEMVIRLSANSR